MADLRIVRNLLKKILDGRTELSEEDYTDLVEILAEAKPDYEIRFAELYELGYASVPLEALDRGVVDTIPCPRCKTTPFMKGLGFTSLSDKLAVIYCVSCGHYEEQ